MHQGLLVPHHKVVHTGLLISMTWGDDQILLNPSICLKRHPRGPLHMTMVYMEGGGVHGGWWCTWRVVVYKEDGVYGGWLVMRRVVGHEKGGWLG